MDMGMDMGIDGMDMRIDRMGMGSSSHALADEHYYSEKGSSSLDWKLDDDAGFSGRGGAAGMMMYEPDQIVAQDYGMGEDGWNIGGSYK
mmetsp:Transcript_41078/g.81704  ORF Transcript_41078/g.81704 Transcript_41078/m.81704 type:complete len:89 (-) Transcript_41078:183-449(-)